ncbi:hypothetical protein [Methylobacterium nodulans]|uniref:Uncharacterized protein n=1 Tax=Methylobacterium nodulans (strain LMG 21967 / CNCM I-2342 / ORS 2060) TaxID=460265 RepID=B8IHK8_METNO|nr:hypothetical protein [Methylobacterium nodulans]ACL61671.1 conserved hypothetical protein [Methylobacterium nodulans ORS 2060]
MADTSLFLNLGGAMVLAVLAGHGIRWALDAWVRLAPASSDEAEGAE